MINGLAQGLRVRCRIENRLEPGVKRLLQPAQKIIAGAGHVAVTALPLALGRSAVFEPCRPQLRISATFLVQVFRAGAQDPLVVRGWSRAESVSGSPDAGYSLYVDLTYADGTPLWGQTANFRCGAHDWELRELVIAPTRPVRSLTVYCLFRGHTGRVWFDDVSLEEMRPGPGAVLF